jgi:hypothetical protein
LPQNGLWDSVQFFLRSTCHAPSVSLHQEALVRLKGGELTRQPTALKNQKFNQKPCQELFSKNRHAKLNSYVSDTVVEFQPFLDGHYLTEKGKNMLWEPLGFNFFAPLAIGLYLCNILLFLILKGVETNP